jgi:hypothetical protein
MFLTTSSTFAIFISVITHPVMPARIVLLGVFTSILAILALVPVPAVRHGAVRTGGASLGAFGIVLGSSVLANATSWENVWERLWVSNSVDWSTPQEKGLSAACAVLMCAGVVTDWALKRKFGENPDEVGWKSLSSVALHGIVLMAFSRRNGTHTSPRTQPTSRTHTTDRGHSSPLLDFGSD